MFLCYSKLGFVGRQTGSSAAESLALIFASQVNNLYNQDWLKLLYRASTKTLR